MATQGLELQIGADVKGAVSGISQLNKSLKTLPQGAGQATTALTNLGRVAQDAPFGFIGIANNIDPLLQSFQSLSREAGGPKNALKALATSLAGPGGVLFAVSVVSSAFIAFGPAIENALTGISKFEGGLIEGFSKGAEAAKKAQLDFEKYSSIINDGSVSTARQKDALNDVNKALSEYGLKINTVADFQRNSAEISALFVQLKQEEAKAQVLAAKAAGEYAKQIEAAFKGAKAGQAGASFASNNPLFQFRAFQQRQAANQIAESENLEKLYTNAVKESDKQIASIIEKLKTVKGVTEQFGGSTKTVIDILKQYRQELNFLTFKEQATGVDLLRQKIDLASKTFEDFVKTGVSPTSAAFQRVSNDLGKFIDQLGTIEKISERVTSKFQQDPSLGLQFPKVQSNPITTAKADRTSALAITPEALALQGQYGNQLDEIAAKWQQQQDIINSVSQTLTGSFINPLIDAFGSGKDPLEGLRQSVKQLVIDLAKAAAQALILEAVTAAFTGGASFGADRAFSAASGGFSKGTVRGNDILLSFIRSFGG